jgi:tRNA pseudouridine synthase 10
MSISCVVWSERELTAEAVAKLDAIHDLAIQQETPIRVLHRRTLMTRPKVIHEAKCEVLNKHYMLLRLTTSAGTYVKEFVHGDRGRTLPNVSSILVRCAIAWLEANAFFFFLFCALTNVLVCHFV